MQILPYKLTTTGNKLTARAGLLSVIELMERLSLSERIDTAFPQPQSNRGIKPSVYLQTLMLMQHEGSFHLDDVRHLENDEALKALLNIRHFPQPTSMGTWLRKMGSHSRIMSLCQKLNEPLLSAALHTCQSVTLDIDATEIVAHKRSAEWTYKSNKGYMPMVGHIAQTGQVLSSDFRKGNQPPNSENLEFIRQCQQALPKGCRVKDLRIDAAGYQTTIIQYCDQEGIEYAIRAVMNNPIKILIAEAEESDWHAMRDKSGEQLKGQQTLRATHCMGDYENAFTLIIQRTKITGQGELELGGTGSDQQEMTRNGYIYRAIATNKDHLTDSNIVHWYNQRGEDSENRIKELKLDFGADTLPCSDFQANALYFTIATLSYNLFALMRQLLPEHLSRHRAPTIRWRLYAIAAKVVKTGRQTFVKLKNDHCSLLKEVLAALRRFEPPPI